MVKFVEFLILQQIDSLVALSFYIDLSIKSKQMKYMDKARDLIEHHMAKATQSNDLYSILQILAIIRKFSSSPDSEAAQEYSQKFIDTIQNILKVINKVNQPDLVLQRIVAMCLTIINDQIQNGLSEYLLNSKILSKKYSYLFGQFLSLNEKGGQLERAD